VGRAVAVGAVGSAHGPVESRSGTGHLGRVRRPVPARSGELSRSCCEGGTKPV
jgi:hypothetical protein